MHPTQLPWYIVLLISVPQTFLIIMLGYQLFNLHLRSSRAFIISLIVGIVAIFARELPLPFGIHTLILIVSSALLSAVIAGTNLWHSLISIVAGATTFGVLEEVFLPVFLKITATTVDSLALVPWLNLLCFLPLGFILVIIYLLAKKRSYVIFDLSLHRD